MNSLGINSQFSSDYVKAIELTVLKSCGDHATLRWSTRIILLLGSIHYFAKLLETSLTPFCATCKSHFLSAHCLDEIFF